MSFLAFGLHLIVLICLVTLGFVITMIICGLLFMAAIGLMDYCHSRSFTNRFK